MKTYALLVLFLTVSCAALYAKGPGQVQAPAEPAAPAADAAPEAQSAGSDAVSKGGQNAAGKGGQPPEQTPSGTRPADPANPGENPATPAEPGNKAKPDQANPGDQAKPGQANPGDEAKPDQAKPGDEAKSDEAKPGEKTKPDPAKKEPASGDGKPEKSSKKSGKGGGKSSSSGSLPSLAAPSSPYGSAAAAGLGALLGGGKDKKEEKAIPREESVSSSGSAIAPAAAAPAAPYSEGAGPKVAVLDFEGETGGEFAGLLAEALKPDLKVYSRQALAAGNYDPKVNRVIAKKIAAETGADYLVAGKVSRKSESLLMISVYLRDAASGDLRMTDSQSLRTGEAPGQAAKALSAKLRQRLAELR